MLERAGIADADAAVVATDGDNTNLVIGQVLQKRWNVPCVVVRVLDPRPRRLLQPSAGCTRSARRRPRSQFLTEAVKATEQPAVEAG